MAIRRMISKDVLDDGIFVRMKTNTQLLYVYLVLAADDDGIVDDIKMPMAKANCTKANLKELKEKKFVLSYMIGEDEIVIIKHWLIMNNIAEQKHKDTNYPQLLTKIYVEPNFSYTFDKTKKDVITLEDFIWRKKVKRRHTGDSKMSIPKEY